jgi:RNA polymerase sigma-70 factor (ECF subfamily)
MDDKTLIKKVSEGDLPAVRFLVEKYKNLVWHIIISMVGHNSDSEDLFQDVIYRVFKECRKFRADARLSTWIGSITHNVCVDYIRNRKKERDLIENETGLEMLENSSGHTIPDQTGKEDLNKIVLETISKLPAGYKTVITLYHLDELSYKEITEITGMPEGTVKSYISRGRNLLREALILLVPDIAGILND